ncbi:hypothetical protein [Paenibacillus terrae]|nr:hypothetical protein [Paenibacillus terrae]
MNNKIALPLRGNDDSHFIVHAGIKVLNHLEKAPVLSPEAFD